MKPHKILIVDDDTVVLDALNEALKSEYDISTATSGQDGLAVMEKEMGIALVISDQRMSGMTGVELMEKLARKYPDTVRILITGFAEDNLFMNAINVGHIFGFMAKPWKIDELRAIVKKGIRHYEKTHTLREAHVRSLLHCGVLSAEQLESVIQATEDSARSIEEILVDNGAILPRELDTAMILGVPQQKDLAEVFLERGLVSESDLEMAREQQGHGRKSLTDAIVEMGYADEDTILTCYALQLGMPYVPLTQFPTRVDVAKTIPSRLAYEYTIVPVDAAGQTLVMAVAEPLSESAKSDVEAETGKRLMTILARRQDIEAAIREYYGEESKTAGHKPEKRTEGARVNAERA